MNNYLSKLSQEDKILYRRILDIISISRDKNYTKFSSFLNPHQQKIALLATKEVGFEDYCFFGGNEMCERKIFCALASYDNSTNCDIFPITAFTFLYRNEDILSHRDFLGTFMSKLIKREAIGDIFVGKGKCVAFVLDSVSDIIKEINKIKNIGITIETGIVGECPSNISKEQYSKVVTSLRLDCIVAALANVSREKSSSLILKGFVSVNYEEIKQCSKIIDEGDVISVRGYGKFLFNQVNGRTKKGRNAIAYSKYI